MGIEPEGDRMVSKHFKSSVYVDFVVGSLAGADRRGLESHLQAGCFSCTAEVEWYRGLSTDLQKDHAEEASESLLESIAKAFRSHVPEKAQSVTVLAQLLFDSFRQPLPAGVRQTMVTERQVLYQAGDMQLDLKVEKTNRENEEVIIGQLLPGAGSTESIPENFNVDLRDGNQVVQSTRSNELGEFVFHVVPRHFYDLEIRRANSGRILLTSIPAMSEVGLMGQA